MGNRLEGPELIGGDTFISDPLIVNIIIPKEKAVKEVKVFGEVAKLVRYSGDIGIGFHSQNNHLTALMLSI